MLRPLAMVGAAAAVLAAAGCASGTSRSIAMAPVTFTFIENGGLVVTRAGARSSAAFASLSGDFTAGVAGYDVVGGNALLPARPLPIALPPGVLSLAGDVTGMLATTTSPLIAALDGGVSGLSGAVPGPSTLPAPPSPAAILAPAAPVTAVAEPAITSLITQGGGLLAAPTAPSPPPPTVTALAGGAVNGVLAALRRVP